MAAPKIVQTTGKRKTGVARVTLRVGTGKIIINNQDLDKYIQNKVMQMKAKEALYVTNTEGKYDIKVSVFGGGQSAQVDAIRQAIARAIVVVTGSDEMKKRLLDYDRAFLVSDTRFKEMKKPNDSKARASRQKSYR